MRNSVNTVDASLSALAADSKYTCESGSVLLTGVQALVRVLLDQRRADRRHGFRTAGFVSGYPGSPLGGFDLEMQHQQALLKAHDIVHSPGLNEDLAATAVLGSQLANTFPQPLVEGVFGMWYGKAPGVDRSGDALRIANFRGVTALGGVLVVAGDDPGARSTIYPSDSTLAFHDWRMPILFPGNVQDVVDLGLHGYALSRASGLWVGFKMCTNVADGSGTVDVAPDRIRPITPTVAFNGKPFTPRQRPRDTSRGLRPSEREIIHGQIELARAYARANGLNRTVVAPAHARVGIMAPGTTYYELRRALELLGLTTPVLLDLGIRIMKVDLLYPLDASMIREFAAGVDELIVIEERRAFIELFVKDALYGSVGAPAVIGKLDERGEELFPDYGELPATLLARILGPRLQRRFRIESLGARLAELERPTSPVTPLSVDRTLYFCSGCPHNSSLVVPENSVVGAGIGCHIMAIAAAREEFGQIVSVTHMGAEGAQWIGAAPFSGTSHIFQNIGDGTFFHSGSLALRAAVAADVNITYKLLYNSAVGMTGGQEVRGAMSIPNLIDQLLAEGVKRVVITTDAPDKYVGTPLPTAVQVRHRRDLIAAERELAAVRGVTVLIHDQQCAAEKRRLRKRGRLPAQTQRVFINERVCEGCGDCGKKSNCLSVQPVDTEFGRKTQIDQTSCNMDYSCIEGECPSFITVETSGATKSARELRHPPVVPEPTPSVSTASFNVFMTGIGGTGVVTAAQILATAASMENRAARVLDYTGGSQKAAPVVSQIQIFEKGAEVASVIEPGGADVFLAFDLLVAMSPDNIARASTERTVLVASSSKTPTGRMIVDTSVSYPDVGTMAAELSARSKAATVVDAVALSNRLFGTAVAANSLLLGVAYQAGALPLRLESLEGAIRHAGVAVELNLAAFAWGRAAVATPQHLPALATQEPKPDPRFDEWLASFDADEELKRILRVRAPDLVAYQSRRYADEYLAILREVAAVERGLFSGQLKITAVIARYLYKLMAYKDEYEVARLHLEAVDQNVIEATFGRGARASWNLQPPLLASLGLKNKVRLGQWFKPVFMLLRAGRRVRGTVLDPFGGMRVRRVERLLVVHYRALISAALRRLDLNNRDAIAELLAMPDVIRGYEHVKLRNTALYLSKVTELCGRLGIELSDDVERLRTLVMDHPEEPPVLAPSRSQ